VALLYVRVLPVVVGFGRLDSRTSPVSASYMEDIKTTLEVRTGNLIQANGRGEVRNVKLTVGANIPGSRNAY